MLNMRRMLAASTENMEDSESFTPSLKRENTPTPHVWRGVKAGIEEAKDAIENKDLDTAEALLREVIEFAPAQSESWHILAAVLNRKGQVDEARDCMRRVIKLNNTNISLQSELPASKRMARILWNQGDHAAALNMLAQLLLASPNDAELNELQQTWTTYHE